MSQRDKNGARAWLGFSDKGRLAVRGSLFSVYRFSFSVYGRLVPLKVLDITLVFFGGFAATERAQVAALSRLWVLLF